MKGEEAVALADAEKAVLLAPDYARAIETRAEIYERIGRRNGAIADYRAALKLQPKFKEAEEGLTRLGEAP